MSESVKKGNFMTKSFSSDNIEWSSKMISANVKQQEIKDLAVVS